MDKNDKNELVILIPENEAGRGFVGAIKLIVERKFGRNKVYKDNWFDRNRITYHTDRIDSKAGRIKQAEDLFFAGEITLQQLEAILIEEAGDIAVYALFILARVKKLRDDINNNLPLGVPSDVVMYLTGGVE